MEQWLGDNNDRREAKTGDFGDNEAEAISSHACGVALLFVLQQATVAYPAGESTLVAQYSG